MEPIAFCFPAWMAVVSLWPLLSMMSLACSSDLRRWLCTRLRLTVTVHQAAAISNAAMSVI